MKEFFKAVAKKFGSRKFLLALISVITGIMTMFGAQDSEISLVSGLGLVLIPAVLYIFTEGKIDAASVSAAISKIDFDQIITLIKTAIGGNADTTSTTPTVTESTVTEETTENTADSSDATAAANVEATLKAEGCSSEAETGAAANG